MLSVASASGARRWTTEVGARTATPTAADGTVYVGGSADNGGFVAAVNAADGRTVWRSSTPPVESAGFVGTAPTVVSDTVFVSFDDGTVRALRRDDGANAGATRPRRRSRGQRSMAASSSGPATVW